MQAYILLGLELQLFATSLSPTLPPSLSPSLLHRGMQAYILLGLELQLFATEEAEAVLWYLDCVLSIR